MDRNKRPPEGMYVLDPLTSVKNRRSLDAPSAYETPDGRFEVIMTPPSGKNQGKGNEPAKTASPTSGAKAGAQTSPTPTNAQASVPDDYLKAYAKRAREQDARAAAEKKERDAATLKQQQERKEKNELEPLRAKARDLQSQLYWWRGQLGLGQYDDNYIYGMIAGIESQLGGIPQKYWY